MKSSFRRATLLMCSAALAAWTIGPAAARPLHRHHHYQHHHYSHHHYRHHHRHAGQFASSARPAWNDDRYAFMRSDWRRRTQGRRHRRSAVRHSERHHFAATHRARHHHRAAYRHSKASTAYASLHPVGHLSSNSLVADARRYLGTNPTGRRSLWCGAFMDKILRDTGHRGGGNLALGYLHYGRRVSGPRVGAIAVMRRRGGGHVGVVAGVDRKGNPIVISGNHNNTVAKSVYPRRRIVAYVVPE